MMNICELPLEIQEKILSYLDVTDLLTSVRTCQQWQILAENCLFKHLCLKNISKDIFIEMTHGLVDYSQIKQNSKVQLNWRNLLEKWDAKFHEGEVDVMFESSIVETSNNSYIKYSPAKSLSNVCCCFVISGDFIIMGDTYNNIVWFDSHGEKVFVKSNCGEQVAELDLLNVVFGDPFPAGGGDRGSSQMLEHDAVIVTSRHFFAIYTMHPWNCKELFYRNIKISGSCKVSVQGNQFVLYNNDDLALTIYCITPSEKMAQNMDFDTVKRPEEVLLWDVSVESVSSFVTPCSVWDWKLWKNRLIAFLQDGSVTTWDTDSTARLYKSSIVSDFLYPFESFMFRGLVFVNVSTARALLNYWHVNTGPPYWLMAFDGTVFNRMKSVLTLGDEITTVCVHGTLILFGTYQGRIYLYRNASSDDHIEKVLSQRPSTIVKVTNGPIYFCDFSVMESYLLCCVKTNSKTILLFKLPTVNYYK